MEPTSQLKSRPTTLYILIGILCLVIFAGLIYWQYQKPEKKSSATEQSQPASSDQTNNQETTSEQVPLTASEKYYQQGTEQLNAKNYSEAIKFFDQAIAGDPYEPQYYSDKSEAQYNSGDKQAAINTLKQGSSLNPDSDLLKSKIDVLSKDQFSDPNAEATRE